MHRHLYYIFKEQLDVIFAYIQKLSSMELSKEDRTTLDNLLISFIGMSNACKSTENIRENISTLRDALDPHIRTLYYELIDIVINLNRAVYSTI